jgi:hypothetical protein
METTDLINFDEVCEPKLEVPTYFMMEQELFETKRKLSLLEERMIRLEEKLGNLELEEKFDKIELEEKINKQKSHIMPIKLKKGFSLVWGGGTNDEWYFCDINSSSIKIDMVYIYFNNCKLFELITIDINDNYISFLKQFKNIKVLEIDLLSTPPISCLEPINLNFQSLFNNGRHGGTIACSGNMHYKFVNSEKYKLLIETLLTSYTHLDIIFKLPFLSSREYKPFEELFMKSTNYKKLHMDFMNGGRQLPPPPSYLNETKEHCIRNNIEFTSNIGL